MLRPSKARLLLLAPLALIGCGGSGASSPASFRALTSTFPNPGAFAVSGDGATVSGTGNVPIVGLGFDGTAWRNGTELSSLNAPDITFNSGNAVNEDGTVIVGTGFYHGLTGGYRFVALRWTEETGAIEIPMPETVGSCYAAGVDAAGQVVVGYEYSSADSTYKAFRSDSSGVTILPTLGAETVWKAHNVSSDGTVAVGYAGAHAVKWIGIDAPVALSTDVQDADALDASRDGSTIVGYAASSHSGLHFACRWTTSAGYESLGTLPGYTQSSAVAVSDDGNVIVGNAFESESIPTSREPFIWTPGGGLHSLRDFLTGGRYEGYRKLTNIEVKDISKDGHTIVGVAYDEAADRYSSFSVRLPAKATD